MMLHMLHLTAALERKILEVKVALPSRHPPPNAAQDMLLPAEGPACFRRELRGSDLPEGI